MAPSLDRFDVAIAGFEFEDRPGVVKPRLVVVLDVDGGRAAVAAAKVTTHVPRLEFPGEVALRDWEASGLLKPSTVRCSKVAEIEVGAINSVIGRLTARDAERVVRGLDDVRAAYGAERD